MHGRFWRWLGLGLVVSSCAPTTPLPSPGGPVADVTDVVVDGNLFSVTLRSDDTGCDQYADWWEVLDATDGTLLGRRILGHSHTLLNGSGNPFTRSADIVVDGDTELVIRGHMNPNGYGGQIMGGSVANGFRIVDVDPTFASGVDEVAPLPTGCAF